MLLLFKSTRLKFVWIFLVGVTQLQMSGDGDCDGDCGVVGGVGVDGIVQMQKEIN